MYNSITLKINRISKFLILTIVIFALIITQTSCSSKSTQSTDSTEPVTKSEYCLNTTCDISIYNMSEKEANKILDGAFDTIKTHENILSKTVKGSDVYKINHANGQPVQVEQETIDLIKLSQEFGKSSGDKFDITIGAITEMWNFTGDNPKVPDDSSINDALKAVDYNKVTIEGKKVKLENEEAQLDLGGIAKGYIADVVAKYLEDQGVESAIVNLGGNVVTIGSKKAGTPFVIGVERPYSDRTAIVGSVEATDKTLVTSGIYERNFTENGKLYHHVLDPATGYPAKTDLEAVTIVADKGNSAFCDGVSTSCLIMGEAKAKEFVAQLQEKYPDKHIEATFINAKDKVTSTDGMNLKLVEE